MQTKRLPYRVTVRRMATGCDYSKTLYLKNESDAFERMAWHVRWAHSIAREGLRFISCKPLTKGTRT